MNVFACAIALISAIQIDVATAAPARELYHAAAEHISGGNMDAAIADLRAITRNYPDSPITVVAVVHLAECLASREQPAEAYDLLRTWEARVKQSTAAKRIEPELVALYSKVLLHAACQRSEELESRGDFVGAILWRRKVVDEPSEAVDHRSAILRLAVVGCLQQARIGESLEPVLAAVEDDSREAARFAVAEMLAKSGFEKLAARQYEILSELADRMDASVRPDWAATVALRRAELMIADKRYADAMAWLHEAKAAYDDFSARHEFDFLLARCAIANIEFDQAKFHLASVNRNEALDADTRCKAGWLMGELLFLQRDYAGALKEYEQVLSENCPRWRARSLLQTAKCYELSGQFRLAKTTYETLSQEFANSEEATEALSRITALQSALGQRK